MVVEVLLLLLGVAAEPGIALSEVSRLSRALILCPLSVLLHSLFCLFFSLIIFWAARQ